MTIHGNEGAWPIDFDIVVAGAGHNSLVAAAYLSKAGYRCLVLEGRAVLGGNVVTEELTLPGFRHDSCGTAHVILQDSPMMRNDELGLAATTGSNTSTPRSSATRRSSTAAG